VNRHLARIRSLWSGARAGANLDAEVDEEFRLHLELRARDLEQQGVPAEEALQRARREFGNLLNTREDVRASRGLQRFDALRVGWLDFKLGFRMLARYPGLTLVGTLAISVGIALSALYFEAYNMVVNPRVPFPEGERVVSIRLWDKTAASTVGRSLYDFSIWRDQVGTLEDLGAAILFERTLRVDGEGDEPVAGAEISASAFRLARISPALGRTLIARDELPSAPPVVVLGHSLWQSRFAGDPQVVGRSVELGVTTATVVGVMPEGFGFPMSQRIWTPLRLGGAAIAPRSGPEVQIFGRLAEGATLVEAEAELAGITQRVAADHPDTHEAVVPRVTRYGKPLAEAGDSLMMMRALAILNGIFVALLAIMCANVGTLVFARAATRGWEIAIRTALGASRGRIVMQLFLEGAVLTTVAAAIGLVLARLAMGYGIGLLAGVEEMPFWFVAKLSLDTVLYAAALSLVGASIIGILPALRVTKGRLNDASAAGLRFGRLWTGVIVAQVAVTVALLPIAADGVFQSNRFSNRAEAIGADHFLIARFAMDQQEYALEPAVVAARTRAAYEELERRLAAERGVQHVTFADQLPVEDQAKYSIEVDKAAGAPTDALRESTGVNVGPGFFETFGTSVVAGRAFSPGDHERGGVLVVNQSFARLVFAGRNPIGHRIRVTEGNADELPSEDWYEIVGIVRDFGWTLDVPREQAAMYYPRLANGETRISLAVRVRDPEAFAPRLRAIAADVSPLITLRDVQPLTDAGGGEARINWILTSVVWFVGAIVLLLSASGIHALMAFTVARRTREIGIRAALGAGPRRVMARIFSRAFLQIGLGVLAGSGLAALWGLDSAREVGILLAAIGVMLTVGLLACAVPLRRALRIHPTEALRAES
jgi:putative ABC transport system permease protein